KIPAPIMALMVIATRSHLRMARTSPSEVGSSIEAVLHLGMADRRVGNFRSEGHTVWCSIPETKHAFFRPIHRALRQPLERGTEQQRVVLLPHRIVRRTSKVDKNLLTRPKT